jgi:hypothetical protein
MMQRTMRFAATPQPAHPCSKEKGGCTKNLASRKTSSTKSVQNTQEKKGQFLEEDFMKQVDLPLVSISTGLSSAMNTLRQSKRGALLSEHQGKYHLFTAGSIAVGRAKGVGTLAALKAHPKLKPRTIIARDIGPVSKMRLVTVVGARGSGSPRGKKENIRVGIRPSRSYILREISGKSAS